MSYDSGYLEQSLAAAQVFVLCCCFKKGMAKINSHAGSTWKEEEGDDQVMVEFEDEKLSADVAGPIFNWGTNTVPRRV